MVYRMKELKVLDAALFIDMFMNPIKVWINPCEGIWKSSTTLQLK